MGLFGLSVPIKIHPSIKNHSVVKVHRSNSKNINIIAGDFEKTFVADLYTEQNSGVPGGCICFNKPDSSGKKCISKEIIPLSQLEHRKSQ